MRAWPLVVCSSVLAAACLDYDALTHAGDATQAADLEMATLRDLHAADFAGLDLAVPDLAMSFDLVQPPPDLLGPACNGRPRTCLTTTDLIFCDDFETGTTAKWGMPTILAPTSGTVGVVSSPACRGIYSLRVFSTGGSNLVTFPANISGAGRPAYARAYVFFTNAQPSVGDTEIFSFVDGAAQPLGVGVHDGKWAAMAGNALFVPTLVAVSAARWYCVEVAVDTTSGQMQVFVDDAVLVDANAGTPTFPLGSIRVSLTPPTGGSQGPQTAYFDEIAVANAYIPCYR